MYFILFPVCPLPTPVQKLHLQDFMLYGHGPDLCQDYSLRHAMANCFEALMGKSVLSYFMYRGWGMVSWCCQHAGCNTVHVRKLVAEQ